MGALDNYDDMGMEGFGDLEAFFDAEILKEVGMAGASGAVAILLGTYGLQAVAGMDWLKTMDPTNRSRMTSGIAIAGGIVAGRGLYGYNRDAAMGVAGGLIGLGLANLVGTFFTKNPLGTPLGETDDDSSMLADYDYEALNGVAGLAETGVQSAAPAFRGLQGPTVTPEQLQGAMVQQETLGAYMPYLS